MTHSLLYAENKTLNFSVPSFPLFNSFSQAPDCAGEGILAIHKVTKNIEAKLALISYQCARISQFLKTGELDLALFFKNND